jgi:hypothetical protein
VEQRTEWQRRMHAVLYHHGCPQSRKLLTLEKRDWIAGLKLPAAAREQLTIASEMIDAIEIQLGPFDLSLRAYARKQPRLPDTDRRDLRRRRVDVGHDPRRARRYPTVFRTRGTRSATPAQISPSTSQISTAPLSISPSKDRPRYGFAGIPAGERRPLAGSLAPPQAQAATTPTTSTGLLSARSRCSATQSCLPTTYSDARSRTNLPSSVMEQHRRTET